MLLLLRWATIAVFMGRAWQHLYWDAPFRTVLWDERLMSGLVRWLGWDWTEWVTSPAVESGIGWLVWLSGLAYVLAAVGAYFLTADRLWARWLVALGALGLLVLAFLYTKEKFYHLGQFFEYSLQVGSPIFLLWLSREEQVSAAFVLTIRVAVALTFTCHGLYAIGYYPRPVNFTSMVMNGLFLSQKNAVSLLEVAGFLDFIVALLLLLPWRKVVMVALAYCVLWGGLTAFARIWSNLWVSPAETVLLQWVHESLYRWPHFMAPAGLLVLYRTYICRHERKDSHSRFRLSVHPADRPPGT